MITGKIQSPDRLEKPRRLSDLAINCAIYFLDCLVPTDIERGAIAVPESIKDRAAERGLGRRRRSYDQLRSPPPELRTHAEEAVGKGEARGESEVVDERMTTGVKINNGETR